MKATGLDRMALRLGVGGQKHRHEDGAVLGIEPRRDLDLLHVLAVRNVDTEQPFDQRVLLRGRLDQIDPDDPFGAALGNRLAAADRLDSAFGHAIGGDHAFFSQRPLADCCQ
jgi:hypothetical protein